MRRLMIAALLLLGAAICAPAQTNRPGKQNTREPVTGESGASPAMQSEAGEKKSSPAIYSYEFSQPNFLINHVLIEHDGEGRGQITFERKNTEPITDPLSLSAAALARIKALWTALDFLNSDRSYQTERQYPHLGTIRLRMVLGARRRTAELNWTSDPDAFALINEYKHAANQAIFIFDITLARENQPLEAPKLMEQLEAYLRRDELSDPQQLVPLLRDLQLDERIPLMARNRAGRLLKKIEK